MLLNFSKHAKSRIEEAYLTINEIRDLFASNSFEKCFIENNEVHYLWYFEHLKEHYILVVDNHVAVTFMPLIWRSKAVSEDIKLKVYNRAMGFEKVLTGKMTKASSIRLMGFSFSKKKKAVIKKWKYSEDVVDLTTIYNDILCTIDAFNAIDLYAYYIEIGSHCFEVNSLETNFLLDFLTKYCEAMAA